MARIFITGGTGYLGRVLTRQASLAGHSVMASYHTQPPPPDLANWLPLDVRDPLAVEELLERLRPEVVIHTAYRQGGPDLLPVTAIGAGNVARAAAAIGARLIHLSTDVVFDGEREGAYTEDDPPSPISAYGAAKAQAEALVAAAHPGAVLVRTSLIYGFAPIDRISQFVLDVATGRSPERLFTDEIRCPIYVEDLAAALLELTTLPCSGPLHVAGAEALSRYAFGILIARAWNVDPSGIQGALSADSSVRRPRNCALDSSRAQQLLRTRLRGASEVLRDLGRVV